MAILKTIWTETTATVTAKTLEKTNKTTARDAVSITKAWASAETAFATEAKKVR